MRVLGDHRRMLLSAVSLLGLLALVGLALGLAKTQRDAKHTVEQRFLSGSETAAALVQTIVSQAYSNDIAVAQRALRAPAVSTRALQRVAAQTGNRSLMVLDGQGRPLAAVPAGAQPAAGDAPFVRQALRGRPSITGALPAKGGLVIEVAVPFDSATGRRVLLVPTPVAQVQRVLGPYLVNLPGLTGHRAYILGPAREVLADSRPQAPRDRALFVALRGEGSSTDASYDRDRRHLGGASILGMSWTLVDTVRASVLYSPVDGWQRTLPWLLLVLLVPAGAFVIVLADRAGRAAERAGQASRAKSAFLASMSHELRTPMTTVIGFSEMLHQGKLGELSQRQTEIVGHIVTSSKHLNQLISEVLDLSRVEEGRMTFHPEDAAPHLLALEVVNGMSGLAHDRGITIDLDAPDTGAYRLDPARFKQVLYNLIGNAIKFTEAGGRVAVRLTRDDHGELGIEVHDNGPGIPADDLDKIFLPFEQGAHRNGGAGLGLAVTHRIIDAQGGRIHVSSEPGHGATFTVTLPRAR
ncbi:HAMP domain-containing histidine kinase [Baekduia soli]|uniref:histidine kinase n=1 Tax=Baekduia soli TaxID=496014 RepID=A0A5B8U081_9ACTN|nr:HAMP domain-containing sensor histidine kinase [Baekduia soli]QEC46399.1 HAMP domain-containing histidine kinase [Baekduia soli]